MFASACSYAGPGNVYSESRTRLPPPGWLAGLRRRGCSGKTTTMHSGRTRIINPSGANFAEGDPGMAEGRGTAAPSRPGGGLTARAGGDGNVLEFAGDAAIPVVSVNRSYPRLGAYDASRYTWRLSHTRAREVRYVLATKNPACPRASVCGSNVVNGRARSTARFGCSSTSTRSALA